MAGRAKFAKLFKKETPLDDREFWREMRQAKYHGVKVIEEFQGRKKEHPFAYVLTKDAVKNKMIYIKTDVTHGKETPVAMLTR